MRRGGKSLERGERVDLAGNRTPNLSLYRLGHCDRSEDTKWAYLIIDGDVWRHATKRHDVDVMVDKLRLWWCRHTGCSRCRVGGRCRAEGRRGGCRSGN